MIYFTADTHFDHVNILRFCDRPFASVEEMNEALIANWNRKIHGDDTVYILGDMFFRTTDPKPILQRLKGKKRLIVGNHDSQWMKLVELSHYFESVDYYLETCDGQRKLTLCHFPQMCWNHQKRSFMVHGHIHENTDMDYWPLIVARENLLNAGCDINNFEPVTFEELVENNRKFKALHPQAAELAMSEDICKAKYEKSLLSTPPPILASQLPKVKMDLAGVAERAEAPLMDTITFEIDQEEYDKLSVILAKQNMTIEDVLVYFLEYVANNQCLPFSFTQEDIELAQAHPIIRLVSET